MRCVLRCIAFFKGDESQMWFVFLGSALIALLDQAIKLIVKLNLKPIGEVDFIKGLLSFVYVENRGAAFGILENQRWIFILITIAVIIFLVYYLIKIKDRSKLLLTSLMLIIGGGIGNLIDRLMYGYVIDYIQLSFFPPVCNLADYCVVIGAVLLCIYLLAISKKDDKSL